MPKAKTVRMRLRFADYFVYAWQVQFRRRWLQDTAGFTTTGAAYRSGTAWARRMFGPDVVIEWE